MKINFANGRVGAKVLNIIPFNLQKMHVTSGRPVKCYMKNLVGYITHVLRIHYSELSKAIPFTQKVSLFRIALYPITQYLMAI